MDIVIFALGYFILPHPVVYMLLNIKWCMLNISSASVSDAFVSFDVTGCTMPSDTYMC